MTAAFWAAWSRPPVAAREAHVSGQAQRYATTQPVSDQEGKGHGV